MSGMIVLHYNLQKEDIIKRTNPKYHVFTLVVNFLTIVWPMHIPHNINEHNIIKAIEHSHAKCHMSH